jgi:hypothetical protein
MKKQETNNTPTAGGQYQSKRGDEYTRDRFRWLDQVAADPELPASAFKVCYAIATALKRNSGTTTLVSSTDTSDNVREVWLGVREIANKIAMSFGTVAAMVRRLEQRGHLQMDHGKPGRGHSHHYRLVTKDQPAEQLKDQPAEHYQNTKDQPAEHFGREKISRLHTNVQPAEQNPSVPLFDIPIEERKTPVVVSDQKGPRPSKVEDHSEIDAAFERFYRQYPKHVAKAAALKAYRTVVTKGLATPEELLVAALRYGEERSGQDSKYTKHAATWLHAGCWDDEPAAPSGTVIDQHGNPVASPPPTRPPPPQWGRRESNTERLMRKLNGGA